METPPSEPISRRDVATDLKASIAARRELDDEFEDHLIESFLARVQQRIDAQVQQQIAASVANLPKETRRHGGGGPPAWVLPASLGVSIPIIAVAGGIAGAIGILFAVIGVIAIVAMYFEYSKQ